MMLPTIDRHPYTFRIAQILGIVVTVISAAGLIGWLVQWRGLLDSRPDLIPLSVNAGVILVLSGLAVTLLARPRVSKALRIVCCVLSGLALLVALGSSADALSGYSIGFVDLLQTASGTAGQFAFRRITAPAALLLVALSLSVFLLAAERRKLAAVVGFSQILAGWIILIAYLFGLPVHLGFSIFPVSIVVAFSLVVIGFSAIFGAGPTVWPLSLFVGYSTRARLLRVLMPVLLVFTVIEDVVDAVLLGSAPSRISPISVVASILMLAATLFAVTRVSSTTARAIDRAEEALRCSLDEKDVLMREIHHRVKNNLQIINSLVRLQRNHLQNPEAREYLNETSNRIHAMGVIHEMFYQTDNYARIAITDFIGRIVRRLADVYGMGADRVQIDIVKSPITLSLERAIPVGLIFNELVTNAFKHGFRDGGTGVLEIRFTEEKGRIAASCRDDGAGIPASIRFPDDTSLGFQIVRTLSAQIKGEIALDRNRGTTFTLSFPSAGRVSGSS